MKLKLFSVLALSGLIAAGVACGNSESDDDGDGGSGGSGGETSSTTKSGSTTTKTSSTATGTPTTNTSTSTGPMGCDTGEPGDVNPLDQVCLDCVNCSQGDECMAEWQAYGTSPDYQAYIDCVNACPDGDEACLTTCDEMYPETYDLFQVAVSCSVCVACTINCNAAANCM
jgi:hypothetical protein